jgi:hypothetical protein
MHKEGRLDSIQEQWFREHKPIEELFDCSVDPHELKDLAGDPAYSEKLKELSDEMDRWIAEIGDQPNLPEAELVKQLWKGEEEQPKTEEPVIAIVDEKVTISCSTEGASIGYKLVGTDGKEPMSWSVYQEPFLISKGEKLLVKAHRIGYKASKVVRK